MDSKQSLLSTKSDSPGPMKYECLIIFFFLFSFKILIRHSYLYPQRLDKMVLLSTQSTCLNEWVRKYLHFCAHFCLSRPITHHIRSSLRGWRASHILKEPVVSYYHHLTCGPRSKVLWGRLPFLPRSFWKRYMYIRGMSIESVGMSDYGLKVSNFNTKRILHECSCFIEFIKRDGNKR